MSAAPKTIEGTWDEVLKHADEFTGHRVKVTIEEDDLTYRNHPAFDNSPAAVEAWVARLRKWAADRPAVGPVDDGRDALYSDRLDRQL